MTEITDTIGDAIGAINGFRDQAQEATETILGVRGTIVAAGQNAGSARDQAQLAQADAALSKLATAADVVKTQAAALAAAFAVSVSLTALATAQAQVPINAVTMSAGFASGLFVDAGTDDTSKAHVVRDPVTSGNNTTGTIDSLFPVGTFTTAKLCRQADGSIKYNPHSNYLVSNDFANATWSKVGCTVTAGVAGPDGTTLDGTTLTATTTTAYIAQNIAPVAQFFRSDALRFKAGTATWCYIEVNSPSVLRAWFNLATGTLGTVDAGLVATISPNDSDGVPYVQGTPGYYHIAVSRLTGATPSTLITRFGFCDANGSVAVTSGKTINIAKAQSHRGVQRLAYRATTTAAFYGASYDWTNGSRAIRLSPQYIYKSHAPDDLTNATYWTLSGCSAVKDGTVAGPHGEPCSLLTINSANATVRQTLTSTQACNAGAYPQRVSGTGRVWVSLDDGVGEVEYAGTALAAGIWTRIETWRLASGTNPVLRFRFETAGDVFKWALAWCAETMSSAPPIAYNGTGASLTQTADTLPTALSRLQAGTSYTVFADFQPGPTTPAVTGSNHAVAFGVKGSGSGLDSYKVYDITSTGRMRIDHVTNDGTTAKAVAVGSVGYGERVQLGFRYDPSNHAMAYNGNVSHYDNEFTSVPSPTSIGITQLSRETWLKRLVIFSYGLPDADHTLSRLLIDKTATNLRSNVRGSIVEARAGSDPLVSLYRNGSLQETYSNGNVRGFVSGHGETSATHYTLESPARQRLHNYEFDKSTGLFTQISTQIAFERPGWATGTGGVQGLTLHKVKGRKNRGLTLGWYYAQDSVTGTDTDDARNLYFAVSRDNGKHWLPDNGTACPGRKILDGSNFPTVISAGDPYFICPGENGTTFQIDNPGGTNDGRIFISLNVNKKKQYALWIDDVEGWLANPGAPVTNYFGWSTTPVDSNGGAGGLAGNVLTEPAIVQLPEAPGSFAMILRNNSTSVIGYSTSPDFGVSWTQAVAIDGDTAAGIVNNGLVQADPLGKLGTKGRVVRASASTANRTGHRLTDSYNGCQTWGGAQAVLPPEVYGAYTQIIKLSYEDEEIFLMATELQPNFGATNVNTSQVLIACTYPARVPS